MYLIASKFTNVALAWVIVFAIVEVCFYFVFKRKANVTDVDKILWQLKLFSGFLAALMALATLYLPSHVFYHDVDLSPAARESAFQDLAYNQQQIGAQLDQTFEILNIVFMMSMSYLILIASFIGHVWRDRQKRAFANDPAIKKPLGLEL